MYASVNYSLARVGGRGGREFFLRFFFVFAIYSRKAYA